MTNSIENEKTAGPVFKIWPKYIHSIKNKTRKDIIVLHGTGGGNVSGCVSSFTPSRVSVPYVIDRNGDIYKLYDEAFDHWHAGGNFRDVSLRSIGIEIVCWNHLTLNSGKYYTWTKKEIPANDVKVFDRVWRGSKYFQKITEEQHSSVETLLDYLCDKYNIPKKFYRDQDTKLVKDKAFKGVVMHSTFHPEKMDFHPQLIDPIHL